MSILGIILIVVEAIVSLLLITVVLMQQSKGGGLGLAFGASQGEELFGSRAGNVLTKATVILGLVFLLNTVLLAVVLPGGRQRTLMGAGGGAVRQPAPQAQQTAPQPAQQPVNPTIPQTPIQDAAPAAE